LKSIPSNNASPEPPVFYTVRSSVPQRMAFYRVGICYCPLSLAWDGGLFWVARIKPSRGGGFYSAGRFLFEDGVFDLEKVFCWSGGMYRWSPTRRGTLVYCYPVCFFRGGAQRSLSFLSYCLVPGIEMDALWDRCPMAGFLRTDARPLEVSGHPSTIMIPPSSREVDSPVVVRGSCPEVVFCFHFK